MTEQEFVSLLEKISSISGFIGGVFMGLCLTAIILKLVILAGGFK